MKPKLCLSPLAIKKPKDESDKKLLLAGNWCLTPESLKLLKEFHIDYSVATERPMNEEKMKFEAKECLDLFNKLSIQLSDSLNEYFKIKKSYRYWKTILHPFLHPIIASTYDHQKVIEHILLNHDISSVEILDLSKPWYDEHLIKSSTSRLFHFKIYSSLIQEFKSLQIQVLDDNTVDLNLSLIGDGKKDSKTTTKLKSKSSRIVDQLKTPLRILKDFLTGKIHLKYFKYLKSKTLALGSQYLDSEDIKSLLKKTNSSSLFAYAENFDTSTFKVKSRDMRKILFAQSESGENTIFEKIIIEMLPTLFFENFKTTALQVRKYIPEFPLVILNSYNHAGASFVDFFIAESIELHHSKLILPCHGGCYGAMEVSLQEKIWAQITDYYVLWSNSKAFGERCKSIKLPSLRFYKWKKVKYERKENKDILLLTTGHYPYRYSYNSIFPYTIDTEYQNWQIRFLENLDEDIQGQIVLRDYHRSTQLGEDSLSRFLLKNKIKLEADCTFKEAITKSKIAIHAVPQTTYLESFSLNHPTLLYWNSKSNYLRKDLLKYYQGLEEVGILHYSPESAANYLKTIVDDIENWWNESSRKNAVDQFIKNVCLTSEETIEQWSELLRSLKH